VVSSIPFFGAFSSSSDLSTSLAAMTAAMKCDASLQASLVLSTERLLLRGWKDSNEGGATM
jgi:hypothetical protein